MSYYQKAKDIYEMLVQGKMIEAFEKFYHQDVVMIEATGEERKEKERILTVNLKRSSLARSKNSMVLVLIPLHQMKMKRPQWLSYGWKSHSWMVIE